MNEIERSGTGIRNWPASYTILVLFTLLVWVFRLT